MIEKIISPTIHFPYLELLAPQYRTRIVSKYQLNFSFTLDMH